MRMARRMVDTQPRMWQVLHLPYLTRPSAKSKVSRVRGRPRRAECYLILARGPCQKPPHCLQGYLVIHLWTANTGEDFTECLSSLPHCKSHISLGKAGVVGICVLKCVLGVHEFLCLVLSDGNDRLLVGVAGFRLKVSLPFT